MTASRLGSSIESWDLTKSKVIDRLELLRDEVINEFAMDPGGPSKIWKSWIKTFVENAVRESNDIVQRPVDDRFADSDLGITAEELLLPRNPEFRTSSPSDATTKTMAALNLTVTAVTAAAALTGVAFVGPLLAVPGGIALIASITVGSRRRKAQKDEDLYARRKEWRTSLRDASDEYSNAFVVAAILQGEGIIDRVRERLNERLADIHEGIKVVRHNLNDSDNAARTQQVSVLSPRLSDVDGIIKRLDKIVADTA